MRISLNSAVPVDFVEVGFGTAASNVYSSMLALGHQVTLDDRLAPVQLHWKQPHLYQNVGHAYNILYFPWESTQFRTGWLEICNQPGIDEIWTTSEWCKKIFDEIGIDKPVKVFPHGISSVWKPKRRVREKNRPLKFLIVDAEANRKGYQEAFDAFRAVFPNDKRIATLTIKTRQMCLARWKDDKNVLHSPGELNNVDIQIGKMPEKDLVKLFQDHDVLIYPSWGEGFGFIPLQMLATGGIAITTAEWAHYAKYLGDFALDSTYARTKWEGEHPGLMCKPKQDHLEELVRKSYDEFQEQADRHFEQAWDIHAEYDWMRFTEEALRDLTHRF